MQLNRLFKMGRHWYAEVQVENMRHTAPTAFATTCTRDWVLERIQKLTPRMVITDAAKAGEQ